MKFIHHMNDGTIRDNLDGVVVTNEEFYQVIAGILERKAERERKGLAAEDEVSKNNYDLE